MFGRSKKTQAIDQALRDAEIEAALAIKAREDPAVYCQFTLRSEITRQRIQLLDGHYQLLDWLQKTKRGVVKASPRLGKTTIVTYGLVPWMIGRDYKRFALLLGSALKDNAENHLRSIRDRMHTSREVRMVFPCFAKPMIEDNTECIRLDREEFSYIKPPTIQVVSPNPKKQGMHFSGHVYDDAMTPELAQSPYLCEQQAEMVMQYESRVTSSDAFRWYIANCFRRWDVGEILVQKFGWDCFLMPAVDKAGKTLYSFVYTQKDVDNYPPSQKDADLFCIPKKDGDSVFQEPWIEKCRIIGLGTYLTPSIDWESLPNNAFVIHGVDPAGGRAPGTATKHTGDDAAIVSTLFAPPSFWLGSDCPSELTLPLPREDARKWLQALHPETLIGRILWITAGKMGQPETIAAMIDLYDRYGPAVFVVEVVGVQIWMAQALALVAPHITVKPFRTGANKHHEAFGVAALANDFASGQWILPTQQTQSGALTSEGEIKRLIADLQVFQPGEHTPDRLIATWLCRMGARFYSPFAHSVGEINMGASYGLQPESQPYAAIPGLGQMLLEKTAASEIPLLPLKKTVKESVDAETKKRFGL